jgi:PAS domain S-box-containing protein
VEEKKASSSTKEDRRQWCHSHLIIANNNNINSHKKKEMYQRSSSSFLSSAMSSNDDDVGENEDVSLIHSCPTAQFLVKVLDGCTERALLLLMGEDHALQIVHKNSAARHFLPDDCRDLRDILNLQEEQGTMPLQSLPAASIRMKNGTCTRNMRTLRFVEHSPQNDGSCTCGCPNHYIVLYIESKNEQVRAMVDHAFDSVVTIDESGAILTANPATLTLFGYSLDELLGHNISILCGGGHSQHHQRYMETFFKTGVAKAIGRSREVPCRHKDGHEFPCELGLQEITPPHAPHSTNACAEKRYFCGYLKDLTLQRKQQAQIQQEQQRAQAMIDASFDSMFEIDVHGRITMVNESATHMLGYTRQEFIGSNISMICGDGHDVKHDQYMQRYRETGVPHILGRKRHVHARRKDGSQFPIELGVKEVKLKEMDACTGQLKEITVFCGFVKDISEQHKDKKALRRQQQLIHNKFFGTEDTNGDDSNGGSGGRCPRR